MILTSRTPLRVSLFGGGTDYPEWFRHRPGAVIGFAINKYVYISGLRISDFVDYRYRVTYSRLEVCDRIEDIEHPVVREVLLHQDYRESMDISIQADLPANAGLGSSSAFAVGFINLVSELRGIPRTRLELAQLAIDTEQNLLKERVGVQDQLHAAFGGINRFDFQGDRYRITPIGTNGEGLDRLADWMLLVYTGVKRHASAVLETQLDNITNGRVESELVEMVKLVDRGQAVFENERGDDLPVALAKLLDEAWEIKKSLSTEISTRDIDELFDRCRREGAIGGKLCGAGGGGFLLVLVPPDRRQAFVAALGPSRCAPFKIEHSGSVVRRHW
jgi:D-glycero-alpha-D-manno-heptose-7-phosphate kinase